MNAAKLVLGIIGLLAVCHCSPTSTKTSTCRPLVGVIVNGERLHQIPQNSQFWRNTLFFNANIDGYFRIKFSYWPVFKKTDSSVGETLEQIDQLYVQKSNLELADLPDKIKVEGMYEESPKMPKGRFQKFKNLFLSSGGAGRDTSDGQPKGRSSSSSSSGSLRASKKRLIEPSSADNINCQKVKRTFVKIGTGDVSLRIRGEVHRTAVFIYGSKINSGFICSIGYSENEYKLPLIAYGDETQEDINLTFDEDGKIIQTSYITLNEDKWWLDHNFILRPKTNSHRKFPKELSFKRTNTFNGDVVSIKYEYDGDAEELDFPGSARYIQHPSFQFSEGVNWKKFDRVKSEYNGDPADLGFLT